MFKDVESKTGVDSQLKYTPWFKLICEGMLFEWWDRLVQGRIGEVAEEKEIRRM
jgi:isopentenyl-diphosphate delta-isomerase